MEEFVAPLLADRWTDRFAECSIRFADEPRTPSLAQPGHVTILTSDVEDIAMLTVGHARITTEKV